eukprot:COSAG01_NODE_11278_length_1966_cov_22.505088_3_plen_96_part_00
MRQLLAVVDDQVLLAHGVRVREEIDSSWDRTSQDLTEIYLHFHTFPVFIVFQPAAVLITHHRSAGRPPQVPFVNSPRLDGLMGTIPEDSSSEMSG